MSIPLDRHEFDADVAAGTDFMKTFAAGRVTHSPDVLWGIYEKTLGDILRVIARVRRRGVAVARRATFDVFLDAVRSCQVVTLVAHWRGARYRATDIVDPATAGRLLESLGSAAAAEGTADPPTAEDLSVRLNRLLEPDGDPPARRTDGLRDASIETDRQLRMWRHRQELDRALQHAVTGGPGVEFADGLVGVSTLTDRFPGDFSGTLDLTVCNSTLVAEEIRRRCRHGQILCNAFPATPDVRMTMYGATIDLMTRRGMSYVDAAMTVRANIRRRP